LLVLVVGFPITRSPDHGAIIRSNQHLSAVSSSALVFQFAILAFPAILAISSDQRLSTQISGLNRSGAAY
jgi:hypothetical protein